MGDGSKEKYMKATVVGKVLKLDAKKGTLISSSEIILLLTKFRRPRRRAKSLKTGGKQIFTVSSRERGYPPPY